ncbi:hypothetical protein [Bacillus massilinigeriensis]|uniref:hypothetical protein n=1 Tax=Bacillus massilionigeriensis TaxID=1805475 RepID=UPI00096B5A6B|nr:hypothetical protein [Bacillus massilionigeriensis]
MDNEKLHSLVERITRELVTNLGKEDRKKVLYIFCDSSAHEPYSDQFIELAKHSIDYDLLFLDGETSAWLGINEIQSTGARQMIAADEYAKAPIELPKDYDAIIIPEIDIDNAARICHGLKGTVKAEIAFSALVMNKPVIIGEDSPGIKRSDRRTLQTIELPLSLTRRFERYLLELKDMGFHLCKQAHLYKNIISLLLQMEENCDGDTFVFNDKVLTTDWLSKNGLKRNTLVVSKNTIISPMAMDFIKDKKMKLVIEGRSIL